MGVVGVVGVAGVALVTGSVSGAGEASFSSGSTIFGSSLIVTAETTGVMVA